jgi:hypothetical protein
VTPVRRIVEQGVDDYASHRRHRHGPVDVVKMTWVQDPPGACLLRWEDTVTRVVSWHRVVLCGVGAHVLDYSVRVAADGVEVGVRIVL